MRQTYIVFLAGLIVIGGLILANWRLFIGEKTSNGPVVILSGIPATYCPAQAEIFQTSNQTGTTKVPVLNCSNVSLASVSLVDSERLYLKLPNALVFSVSYNTGVDRVIVGLRVGDANNDNVIDSADKKIIADNIFTGSQVGDVDLDRQVTSDDFALAKINEGVGEKRPDNGVWQ